MDPFQLPQQLTEQKLLTLILVVLAAGTPWGESLYLHTSPLSRYITCQLNAQSFHIVNNSRYIPRLRPNSSSYTSTPRSLIRVHTMASSNPPGPRQRRRHSSSAVSTIADAAVAAEQKVSSALLLLWDELPHWRRDNAFILTGYRPASNSYLSSLLSTISVHNESVNIWTHAVGSLVLVPIAVLYMYAVIAPRYPSAGPADELVFACFSLGAALCLGMSATFHTLSNHSEAVAKWGNKLDYSGIVCLIVGSYIPAMYYGLFCDPGLMSVYLYGVSLVKATGETKSLRVSSIRMNS